ncbi:hypothetical protein [Halalkalicoccus jeotgali]|uniref:DUF7988 domain-containing protein n=1 Tax=Halalkalicoccus jeotgali (strain DSM 18796 / CECT 7217 / JCM 14584 / KCTC 4019 / B3) TaxID=795797 RepID=D8J2Q4_HALJB|nr:hypothetical protein [Halalkalicoccus jeotgali]ADJ15011.1 hypothetical protein HacjB3_08130 [Halalkalicoccus jeotgali B3]ELY34973.1 hypothetical protein C497_14592 [Halalkalicoccus jeotgali B3]
MNDPARVRARLLAVHSEALEATIDCAEAVASSGTEPATDREAVAMPLRAALDHAGVLETYPAVLASAVDTLGQSLSAPPVAAPPYVTITGTGPILRASLPTGRLVIRLAVFALERDPKRYVRTGDVPEEILVVELR